MNVQAEQLQQAMGFFKTGSVSTKAEMTPRKAAGSRKPPQRVPARKQPGNPKPAAELDEAEFTKFA